MSAIPKEIKPTEKLFGRITAGGKVYEQELNGNNQGVILLDMAEKISPMFIIKSDIGLRQEAAEEQYTGGLFSAHVSGEWARVDNMSTDTQRLNLWIMNNGENLSFSESDIETAEFIVQREGNNGEEMAAPSQDYLDTIQGDRVTAVKQSGQGEFEMGFYADFDNYIDKPDKTWYSVYFSLTTKDGVRYVTPSQIAEFQFNVNSANQDGYGELIVVFE